MFNLGVFEHLTESIGAEHAFPDPASVLDFVTKFVSQSENKFFYSILTQFNVKEIEYYETYICECNDEGNINNTKATMLVS